MVTTVLVPATASVLSLLPSRLDFPQVVLVPKTAVSAAHGLVLGAVHPQEVVLSLTPATLSV